MHTSDFDFELPEAFIAQRPARPRDSARLLEVRADGLNDRTVRALPELLGPDDLLVFNDTRVIPAQLQVRRGQARVGLTLHKPDPADDAVWHAFAKPAKRLRPGDTVHAGTALSAEVLSRDGGEVTLRFDRGGAALRDALEQVGQTPLPPYIDRPEGPDEADQADYQTVFAREPGAVAAPTAGLHFTDRLLAELDARGVRRAGVTLHVGAGTFLPVKSDDPREHPMHAEHGHLDAGTAEAVNATRAAGGRVVAVGTTALRLLETAAGADGTVHPFAGESDLFILPGYRFKAVDCLMTNFHLPRSTLFMLVCAFAGTARMQAAYAHAKAAGYRFYSYGDACFLHRQEAAA